jgi:hypothetical protein
MKSAPLSVLAAAVLLGSATAGVTTYLLGPGSAGSRSATQSTLRTPGAGSDAELLALSARVDALVEENEQLRMSLATLESRPTPVSRAPVDGFVTKSEFEAFEKEIRAALSSRDALASEPEELKEQVADLLIDLRKEEAIAKVRDYQEKRSARLDEDVAKLTEWLELNGYQANEMRTILASQYEREDDVRRLWEDGADDELLGERKRSGREQFHDDLAVTLTPGQLDTFWTRISGGGKN